MCPTGSDVRFWSWNDYLIEELWDYGFIEVSTDDGSTWTQLEVLDEAGNMVSTDEDPNGNLAGRLRRPGERPDRRRQRTAIGTTTST